MPTRGATRFFLAGLVVYACAQWLHTGQLFAQSHWPYYVYYAHALLDGQLHFDVLPPAALDLVVYHGRAYLYHPPFPSLLMAPAVVVFGIGLPDRFVSVLLGALDGALFYGLLLALDREGFARSDERERGLLTALFLFGTVHEYLVVTANHWELSQVVTIWGVLLALLAALAGRPVAMALALVAVLWTRSHVVLVASAPLGLYLWRERRRGGTWDTSLRRLAPAAALGVAGVALLLAFDAARFGNAFETGTSYQNMHGMFRTNFERYGLFDLHYLPRNLNALLIATPIASARFPFATFSPHGLSIFLATPFYLYLLRSLRRETRPQAAILWAGVVPVLVPVLLTIGTGEIQFGHRYSADVQPLLLPLAWLGAGMRFTRTGLALLVASIAMNALGTWWFVSTYAN
ncbi:MAG TPA: hypothetical protein VMW19_19840 [Myxococcota bacterium]|nr:hypothetical protein [Myxococcota bacterium]